MSTLVPHITEGKVVKNKLTKSGTNVGANYREANRARSRADFKNRIKICESESSETVYWLEIIGEMEWIKEDELMPVYKESKELLAIFTSISKNST